MAAGYTCMNDLVIIQTAQGFLKHLEENDTELLNANGIVIGYDGRYNSKRFAELTTALFLHRGIRVHLFSAVTPTPFVPFAVTKWKCAAGIMVTASHNPKEDNGYKVYGWNGAQIVSPVDKSIHNCIQNNTEPWPTAWDTQIISGNPLVHDPLLETIDSYNKKIEDDLIENHKAINKKTALPFVYTAMHGVGYNYIAKVFEVAGLKLIPVEEQKDPDPEFPTVKFPNPEEGKSSLDLSIKTANQNNVSIILANDPDADRLAVAEKNKITGEWKVYTGNEIGALLGWWALHCYQEKNSSTPLSDVYMLASTVSSKILRSIAKVEGFNFIETLTGFKWMGNKAYDLIQNGKKVIFAFEEAIGFMYGSEVLDKDGVSAAVHVGTMISYLYHHGLSLKEQLDEIYKEYGYHISDNSYYMCHDPDLTKNIFEKIRNHNGKCTYPTSIFNGKYTIENVRDLTTGYDNSRPDNKAVFPVSSSSQMVTFSFTNGLVATLRTSGTEPKIKYYTEMCASPEQNNLQDIQQTLKEMVNALVNELLEPEKNGLLPKKD
ncbi:Phosphoglucomutase 2a [Carabus blaptoides fortunei]